MEPRAAVLPLEGELIDPAARRLLEITGWAAPGDEARVELTLPEAGVCGGAGVFDELDTAAVEGGCCAAAAPQLITLSTRADG